MDIYSLLQQDHRTVAELFTKLEEAEDAPAREKIFLRLKSELTRHKEAEEHSFYAVLSNFPDLAERIDEALEEHADVAELLEELEALSAEDEDFLVQIQELKEEVEHHVEEEERDIFEQARRLLDAEQAAQIAETFQAEKQALGA